MGRCRFGQRRGGAAARHRLLSSECDSCRPLDGAARLVAEHEAPHALPRRLTEVGNRGEGCMKFFEAIKVYGDPKAITNWLSAFSEGGSTIGEKRIVPVPSKPSDRMR